MKYKKFKIGDGLNAGDIFYKFDPDITDLPPIKLVATEWCKKRFDRKESYGEFIQTFPDSIMEEWEKEYGQSKRKWKKFLNGLKKTSFVFFDNLYIEE